MAKKGKKDKKRRILISYFAHDRIYENGALCTINGRQDANAWKGELGTVGRAKNAHLPMLASNKNYKNFAFIRNLNVYSLFVNVVTDYDTDAEKITTVRTQLTLYSTPKKSAREWVMMSRDIELLESDGETAVRFNPSAVAQVGDRLYLIDYDSRKIYIIGTNELNGLPDGSKITPAMAPFDLSAVPELEDVLFENARGTAIGAAHEVTSATGDVRNCLFALFNMPQDDAAEEYEPSVLVRLNIGDEGELTYETKTEMGLNTPELNIFKLSNKKRFIVVTALGGMQKGGSTNGIDSCIMSVPAFDNTWPEEGRILITGVNYEGGTVNYYDIHGVAGSPRPDNFGRVIIATAYYNTETYTGIDWRFYETTIALLLNAQSPNPDDFLSLETAVSLGVIRELDAGQTSTPSLKSGEDPYGIYFFNALYEAGGGRGSSHKKDRYWLFIGTELIVTNVYAYGSPTRPGNPYKRFPLGYGVDDIGGENVQSAELVIELTHQVVAGTASKRSVTALPVPKAKPGEAESGK
jgi:hypothetical protein